jgi:N-acyl-D-aspartate/D-glutamate deacylase
MILRVLVVLTSLTLIRLSIEGSLVAKEYDLVVSRGRVIDPQSGLDGIRDVGIDGDKIVEISEKELVGKETIHAQGWVVAPGFIDLHQHAWDVDSIRLKALDGVTSVFELEIGTADVKRWFQERAGVTCLNHGVSIGHVQVRMALMGDPPAFLPPSTAKAATELATEEQIHTMARLIAEGLDDGAAAVGFGLAYTPSATQAEIEAMFRVAASRNASCHIHVRSVGQNNVGVKSIVDAARMAATTKAALCIVHMQAGARETMPELLRLVDAWQASGQDVTGEVYPWTAGMTEIQSAIFSEGFTERLGLDYGDLQWGATGERLTQESFHRYREQGGLMIVHNNTEAAVTMAINHPKMMIASDGLKGHPRNAGTFSRVLGQYSRVNGGLDLMTALAKMTILPAKRLEAHVPCMKSKGRIQRNCDADITIFDSERINAKATYESPFLPSEGIGWVIVNGVPIVRNGELDSSLLPGRPIRAE